MGEGRHSVHLVHSVHSVHSAHQWFSKTLLSCQGYSDIQMLARCFANVEIGVPRKGHSTL